MQLWLPFVTTGLMMGVHRLLMRGSPRDARTPLWKWAVVLCSGMLATFCLLSVVYSSLPAAWCVIVGVAGLAILTGASWLIQRRLEDAQGGWRN
jgi:hypothetical protein